METQRKFRVLIADNWHIHRRNFASLFDYFKEDRVSFHIMRKRSDWWKHHGDYASRRADLIGHLGELASMEPVDLLNFVYRGVPVFACSRAEILSYVLARPAWRGQEVPSHHEALIAILHERECDTLLLNMAAAMDWIDFWNGELDRFKPFTHCCLFSGSYIYTRTLLDICRRRGTRTMVLEAFFTGNEFYCEERSTPIANASDLGLSNYYASIRLPDDEGGRDRMRAQAHRAFAAMNNKNVKQQKDVVLRYFDNAKPTLLIIGQVLNDFSIIETMSPSVATLPLYRTMIEGVLKGTEMNVIFKSHPWEHHRPHLRAGVTHGELQAFAAALTPAHRERLEIVETPPLTSLLMISDWVATICSQGALEACNMGFKPALFGAAFYGGKGFTHDYEASSFDSFLADAAEEAVSNKLTLGEFRQFEDFLARSLVRHLMTNDYMGVRKLRLIFNASHGALAVRTIPSSEIGGFDKFQRRQRRAMAESWRALKSTPYAVIRNFARAKLKALKRIAGLG